MNKQTKTHEQAYGRDPEAIVQDLKEKLKALAKVRIEMEQLLSELKEG